jgi:hypothetical protein
MSTITREQVLEAIRTEPLQAGQWSTKNTIDCPVCVVGGVLRSTLGIIHGFEIADTMYSLERTKERVYQASTHTKDTHFLIRLSTFFEDTVKGGYKEGSLIYTYPAEQFVTNIREL